LPAIKKLFLIDFDHPSISVRRQCALLQLNRSTLYYEKQPEVSSEDLEIMGLIDKIYTDFPCYGYRRMQASLKWDYERTVNHKRVLNLMNIMGIEAIYPKKKKNLSQNDTQFQKYPYLLRNLLIKKPNHVWGTDITYIKLKEGFMYLTAVLDWYSRFVLAWKLSNTLTTDFVIEAMRDALQISLPEIANSDQGVQFTSCDYQNLLLTNNVKISMDGRGRAFDNIFVERLWRSVKYEDIYLKDYSCPKEVDDGLTDYFQKYNFKRRHQSLNYLTPADVYFKS